MKCYNCGNNYRKSIESLEVDDPYIGIITVQGFPYYLCDNCGDILYPAETSRKLDECRQNMLNRIIRNFPLREFLTANETAELLGITKQALNKNRRISRGFIYKSRIGNFDIYLKESVEKFKATGDGRFILNQGKNNVLDLQEYLPRKKTKILTH
jgi:hypothetical protein